MILLDVQLHGEDVWPLVDELRARGERFILITGYACPESLPAAYRDVRFLEKPFDESTLAAKILEAL